MASRSCPVPLLLRLVGCLAGAALALPLWAEAESKSDYALFRKYQASAGTIEKAAAHYRSKQYAQAEKGFHSVLQIVPDHHQARYFLAQLAYLRGDYAGSLRQIEAAIASLDRLRILYSSALVDDQRQAMEHALMVEEMRSLQDSWHPKTRGCGGTTLLIPVEGAAPHAAEPDPFRTPAAYHLVHGNALLRLGRLAEAEVPYRLAVAAEPHSAEAWTNLLGLLLAERKIPAALQALDQAEGRGVQVGAQLRDALVQARAGSGGPG